MRIVGHTNFHFRTSATVAFTVTTTKRCGPLFWTTMRPRKYIYFTLPQLQPYHHFQPASTTSTTTSTLPHQLQSPPTLQLLYYLPLLQLLHLVMAKYSRKATNKRLPSAEILPQGQNDIKTIAAGGIEDNIYHNLKGLDEIKFSNEALGFDPSDVVARASRGRNKIFEKNLRAWVDLPTDKTPRRQKANAIANCFNRIQSLTARVRNKAARREWSLLSSKPYKAAQRFAGFAVVDKPSRAPQAIPGEGLQKAHAVLDLSYDDNSPLEDSLNRLAKAALDMFHCQPDRRFVIGISVVGSSALLTVFNRSGMFL